MVVGPLLLAVGAFWMLHGDVRVVASELNTHEEAFIRVQDARVITERAQDARIQSARDDTNKIHTSQQVLEATTTGTAEDVKENRALLEEISRQLRDIQRQN